ncbi:hypothetical protein [Sphingomonas sp. PB4P5]|uniref:hypothetical protein n=1 Tax=Parasphingomonas puruogangriensis TaxID=3096155 RepID=UPI002FC5F3CE
MLTAVLMLAAAADQQLVVASFTPPAANPDGMVAEQIKKPANVSPEAFADKLVEAEGLTSWRAMEPINSPRGATLAYRSRQAGNGREVVVYYSPAAETVCRIRRERGGLSDAHQAAIRWCAASLGVTLPKPAPSARNN